MKIEQLLENNTGKKRILVVSDMSRAQSLFRQYEAKTGKLVQNVTCKTISQLVMDVYRYQQAENGFQESCRLLEPDEAMMLFRNIIFSNIDSLSYFNEENMLDIATSQSIFRSVNLIRLTGWSGKECADSIDEMQKKRIRDLKFLIEKYEAYLTENSLLDSETLLLDMTAFMKESQLSERKEANQILFGGEIYALRDDMDCLSGKEAEFVSLVLNNEERQVMIWENTPDDEVLSGCLKEKVKFYKGYGSFNEAAFIANDILENKIPLGEAAVYYTSTSQLPALDATFKGNGLRACHLSKRSLADDAFISFARKILAWAKDNFSEKALETILASSAISVKAKNKDGKEKNILGGQAYYDLVLNARNRMKEHFTLGWGYDRNIRFIELEKKWLETESEGKTSAGATEETLEEAEFRREQKRAVLEMLEKLLAIFGQDGKVYEEILPKTVYGKLVEFIGMYSNKGIFLASKENTANGLSAMKKLSGVVSMENRELPLNRVIDYLDELILLAGDSEKGKEDAISIQKLNQWTVLERTYVYVIGLSLKDSQGETIESPVLSDCEMECFLNEGYKPTIINEVERKERDIRRTLATFSGKRLTMGYSDYDTVNFCDNNPSGLYRTLLHQLTGKKVKDLQEFVYGNPDSEIQVSNPNPGILQANLVRTMNWKTSNSSLEIFLDCPKKYAYEKLLYIPKKEYVSCDYGCWLDALHYGSFFHSVAEQYVKKNLIKPGNESYVGNVQESEIKQMISDVKDAMIMEYPTPFLEKADTEAAEIENLCVRFFGMLHKQLTSAEQDLGWRVLVTEKEFSGLIYTVTDLKGVPYDFELNGYVDRIDYRFDNEKKKLYLRVIDYKTGKKKNKESNHNAGKVIQHVIYKKAVMDSNVLLNDLLNEIERLEGNHKATDLYQDNPENVVFDSFQYIFPQEDEEDAVLQIEGSDIEDNSVVRLRVELTALAELKYYPDHIDLVQKLEQYKRDEKYQSFKDQLDELYSCITKDGKPNDDEKGYCKYCNYGNICPKRKAGEI